MKKPTKMLTQQLKKGGLTFFKIEHAAVALIPRHGELCGVLRHRCTEMNGKVKMYLSVADLT